MVAPSNTAVVAGDWMAMECRTTNESHVDSWEFKRTTKINYVEIFINHDGRRGPTTKLSSRFDVDMDESGSGLLYTNTTQLNDAGLYLCCIDKNGAHDSFSSHLTVLGKN